jgi:hypothetical protein
MALSKAGLIQVGNAAAEDRKIIFDGNAQDWHIGIDDSADDLVIGLGSTLGTTSHIVIDEAGHVTKPLQSAFLITTASGSQHFDNSFLTFTTEKFDQNSDVSSSVFTAPVTGRYQFNSLIRHSGSGFTADTAIYNMLITSNQDFYVAMDGDYEESAIMLSIICDMDAGDTAKVKAYGDNDADVGTDAEQGWFSGYLVC